jgi:uncharacterized membrane protein
VAGVVVLPEQVLAEVASKVAPHGVDVVGVVLRVVEFGEEVGCLNAVIMRIAVVEPARPREVDIPTGLVWLVLGLEFELGADVIRTAISPTWSDIGQLGAIATIRTVLNYFLEKEVEKYSETPSVPKNPSYEPRRERD